MGKSQLTEVSRKELRTKYAVRKGFQEQVKRKTWLVMLSNDLKKKKKDKTQQNGRLYKSRGDHRPFPPAERHRPPLLTNGTDPGQQLLPNGLYLLQSSRIIVGSTHTLYSQ